MIAPKKMKSLSTFNDVYLYTFISRKNKMMMMMKEIKYVNKWGRITLVAQKIQHSKDINSPKIYC